MNRNIEVGDVLGEVFSIYRDNAGVLLPVAFLLFLVVAVVNGLVDTNWLMIALAFVVSIAASTLYQGMVVELVSDVQDGRRDSAVGELLRSATPVIGPLIGAGLFAGIWIGVRAPPLHRPGAVPADDLGGDRPGHRGRARAGLRAARPLAPAGPRQRLAGLRRSSSSPS